ncbi:DUF1810 domain-containing protein [Mesorhizobium japonicum]|uniref:Calpastatin n=1 Tax=Mesorhizobium japonicum (strain LMG 29417 / CECT 9101 / MAFF 303099) TaxID=266835 RepID=Q98LL7_RHILO|nr:DUF1810 family protein [Mesorhizobium japonicum]BAB48446.1 calpastatin [Mesorhizobium japonicum MAFF 303099]
MSDEYNLHRFVRAQAPVYEATIDGLRRGTMNTSHMEFIFPRLASRKPAPALEPYAIRSLDEASAYLAWPILGGRYRECVDTLHGLFHLRPRVVFGEIAARKLHASLTLFSEASDNEFLLETMFDAWFDGMLDEETMSQIAMMR